MTSDEARKQGWITGSSALTPLVGRERECAELAALLFVNNVRGSEDEAIRNSVEDT